MNYAFTKACLDFYAFGNFTPKMFADKLNEILMRNTDAVNLMMLNLLDSHDTHRFLTRVGGDLNKLKSALAVMFFFVGAPCIYYGTEIALEGGYDPDNRRTMNWEKAAKETALKELIRELSKLKALYLTDEKISIFEREGLVVICRGQNLSLTLAVNQSGKKVKYSAKPILSQGYDGEFLSDGGFVVHD